MDDSSPRGVAAFAALAQERMEELRLDLEAEGRIIQPVVPKAKLKLATQPWGAAWMRQLAYCEQQGYGLAPGRSLLRHGCVLDVELHCQSVHAWVSAEELYEVDLRLAPMEEAQLDALREICNGRIDSLLSLISGKMDAGLLAQLCDPEQGLLPLPHEWKMTCSCPEWGDPCPHAAAAIYAVGCLIDEDPARLFALRGIDPALLYAAPKLTSDDFDAAALADTFGIDIDV